MHTIFIKPLPGCLDWTSPDDCGVEIHTGKENIYISLKEEYGISKVLYFLDESEIILTWNIKNLFSFIKATTNNLIEMDWTKIFDLKILESYIGIENKSPKSLDEAKKRINYLFDIDYPFGIYKKIYLPLLTKVVPNMESVGILNTETKKKNYSYYEISGQTNGRMSCLSLYKDSFMPHSLNEENRSYLKPPFFDYNFIYADYSSMEIYMLNWLSKDEVLTEIINSGSDCYSQIWKILTKMEFSPETRSLCKSIFLPVMFGAGMKIISEKTRLDEDIVVPIVNKIKHIFKTSIRWIEDNKPKDCSSVDFFGRKRFFEESELYKYRNFIVSSPSATYCLLKLVKLFDKINSHAYLAMSIHDGYVLYAPTTENKKVKLLVSSVLEEPEEMFNGLKLLTVCKTGDSLNFNEN